ncbi:hypothetical protein C8Q76DRAFT_697846 [Earliella scabrosa]|nr:hypothetical protein C8Q76DRAFT_697846 [Earliella scabrosa]
MSHSPAPSTSPSMYAHANGDADVPSSLPISVRIKRFATDDQGGQYELVERPHRVLELGMDVFLEMRFPSSPQFDLSFCLSVPTGVEGTIVSFQSLKSDAVELIIRNNDPSGRFHYLLVPFMEGYLSLPEAVVSGFLLLKPYLITQAMADAGGDQHGDEETRDIQAYLAALALCRYPNSPLSSTTTPRRCERCDQVLRSPDLSSEYARFPSPALEDKTSDHGSDLGYAATAMSGRERRMNAKGVVLSGNGHTRALLHAWQGFRRKVVQTKRSSVVNPRADSCLDTQPLVVRNLRPPYLSRGGRYELVERPVRPVTIGFHVTLHMRIDGPERSGIPSILFPVGIQGTIIGVETLRNDGIEFVIRNTGYRNSFEYLFVRSKRPGFIAFPSLFILGYSLIRPYLVPVGLSEVRDDMDAGGHGGRLEEHWRTWLTKAHQSPDWVAEVPEPQEGEVFSLHLPRRYTQYTFEGFSQQSQHATNLLSEIPSEGVQQSSLNVFQGDILNLSPM